jgi:hypothetical protein
MKANSPAVTGDWQCPLAQHAHHAVDVRAVQQPVSQGDAIDPVGLERLLLGRDHGREMGVECVASEHTEGCVLGQWSPAVIDIAISEDHRLRDEPVGPDDARRVEEVGGAVDAQRVGWRSAARQLASRRRSDDGDAQVSERLGSRRS